MNRLPTIVMLVGFSIHPAHAIVTSGEVGSDIVAPGEPRFGINTDGVVMVGAAPPSGEPLLWGTGCLITDRHVLTAAHLFDDEFPGVDFLAYDFDSELAGNNALAQAATRRAGSFSR